MRKLIILVTTMILSTAAISFADDDNLWINVGYSYYLPESSSMKAPLGPVDFTVGGEPVDWFAIDLTLGYLWDMKVKNDKVPNAKIKELSTFSARLNFLFQPAIDVEYFVLRPYIGAGAVANMNATNTASNIFTPGFSVKAGFRFTENGLLFGIGAEYIFNQFRHNNEYVDGSGYLFGGEIGIMF